MLFSNIPLQPTSSGLESALSNRGKVSKITGIYKEPLTNTPNTPYIPYSHIEHGYDVDKFQQLVSTTSIGRINARDDALNDSLIRASIKHSEQRCWRDPYFSTGFQTDFSSTPIHPDSHDRGGQNQISNPPTSNSHFFSPQKSRSKKQP